MFSDTFNCVPATAGHKGALATGWRAARRTRISSQTDGNAETTGTWQIQYLYDAECPLRSSEVVALRRLDNNKGRISFVDISDEDYDPSMYGGITYADAMGPPAAILKSGEVVRSVEVYRKLYEAVGLGFVWAATKLPLVGPVVDWVFDVWCRNRLRLTGRPSLEEILQQKSKR
ncbi:hypothetical protein CYMTET_41073 [Cymbomonas tetramitiformis]|uniref:Thiol-disulfide oxidoreductase DCC n=1 Tax=Cymbomonas tetramitiformis TaxID=36881 RepID=A0AAE0F411_9CHLO|nr:hypothetical protein CYMTET_41073 [Cymbomonas tetramitiformis]|eukprot:gene7641-9103_t